MPEFPRYPSGTTPIPRVTATAPALDQGLSSLEGRALQTAGGALGDIAYAQGREEVRKRNALAIADNLTKGADELDQYRTELEKDPDHKNRAGKFAAKVKEVGDRLWKTFDDGDAQAEFGQRFFAVSRGQTTEVRRDARKSEIEEARVNLTLNNDKLLGMAVSMPEQRQIYLDQVRDAIMTARAEGVLTAAGAKAELKNTLISFDRIQAQRLIRQNPGAALAALEDPKKFAELDTNTREQLKSEAFRIVESRRNAGAADLRLKTADVLDAVTRGDVHPDEREVRDLLVKAGPKYQKFAKAIDDATDRRAETSAFRLQTPDVQARIIAGDETETMRFYEALGKPLKALGPPAGERGAARRGADAKTAALFRKIHEDAAAGLESNPYAYLSKAGVLRPDARQPLDFNLPADPPIGVPGAASLTAQFRDRDRTREAMRPHFGAGEPPVLEPPEAEHMKRTFYDLPLAQQTSVVTAARQGLSPAGYKKFIEQLFGDNPALFAAGASTSPHLSERLLQGAELLRRKESDDFLPPAAGLGAAAQSYIGEAYGDNVDMARMHFEAAKALHLQALASKGNRSKIIDTAQWQADMAALGTVIEYHDRKIVAPATGMTAENMRFLIASLSDGDLVRFGNGAQNMRFLIASLSDGDLARLGNGAPRVRSGQKVTAREIENYGVLHTISPGVYRVSLRNSAVLNDDGESYVLDLRAAAADKRRWIGAKGDKPVPRRLYEGPL